MSGLLLAIVMQVRACWIHKYGNLTFTLVSTDCGTWSYQCSLSDFTLILLHVLMCS
jgi:hypothetical protein